MKFEFQSYNGHAKENMSTISTQQSEESFSPLSQTDNKSFNSLAKVGSL